MGLFLVFLDFGYQDCEEFGFHAWNIIFDSEIGPARHRRAEGRRLYFALAFYDLLMLVIFGILNGGPFGIMTFYFLLPGSRRVLKAVMLDARREVFKTTKWKICKATLNALRCYRTVVTAERKHAVVW